MVINQAQVSMNIFFEADEVKETFIDLEGFGKGVVFVNGHHCGRFYEAGPTLSLYIPGPFLKKGLIKLLFLKQKAAIVTRLN